MTAWSSTPVCSTCVERVGPQHDALCNICGEAMGIESARFAAALGSETCTMCRLAPPAFTRAVAYSAYEDELRGMIHLFKYSGVHALANAQLGDWLAETILQLAPVASTDLTVIAVPLFASRERRRGFNQSVILADAAIAKLTQRAPAWKLTAAHAALSRVKDTDAQFALNPGQRRRNLRGAFRVADPAAMADREVLLIDDIMTTGATARECARVLIRAGAAKVWVATLARAQAEKFSATQPNSGVAMWDAVLQPDSNRQIGFVQSS